MKTIFVSLIAVFLIAAISVSSAGFVPVGYVELNVLTTDGRQAMFYELPENYTMQGDLDMDGIVSKDKDDVLIAQQLRLLTPLVYTDDAYMVAADMNKDGKITAKDIRRLIKRSHSVSPIVRYTVGDVNRDGYFDRQDLNKLVTCRMIGRGMCRMSLNQIDISVNGEIIRVGDYNGNGRFDRRDLQELVDARCERLCHMSSIVSIDRDDSRQLFKPVPQKCKCVLIARNYNQIHIVAKV